ncbi:hypothetical protein BY996DRAFT_6608900 [Phakopsora pachyrhizi]|nr:hypothetical protein BY996DRAFT_6608900 [Phakopsora pachyrhizi]
MRYKLQRAFTITKGRTIISNSKNEIFAIMEYRAFTDMTLEERKEWNEPSMGLFREKKFTNLIRINSKIKRGSMWPIGWRKAMTKAYSKADTFSSALTFTTSEFENTPHIDNDSSHIAAGWWMQVNKKTEEGIMDENKEVVSGGEFYFPQENVGKKLSTAFEKYRCGLHPSHFKVRDGKSFS